MMLCHVPFEVAGMVVQPLVGRCSDRPTGLLATLATRYGRRRVFLAAGACALLTAQLLVGGGSPFSRWIDWKMDENR